MKEYKTIILEESNSVGILKLNRPKKLNAFIELMSALGETEITRGGVVAISRGSRIGLQNAKS